MIISTKHRFVLLSNTKCASTSLTHSFKDHVDLTMAEDYRLRHTDYKTYKQFVEPYLQHALQSEPDNKFDVFCLFREPVDWVFSWYKFRRSSHLGKADDPEKSTTNITWDDYLTLYLKGWPQNKSLVVGQQHSFVTLKDGSTTGLNLYRYENLHKLTALLSDRIGKQVGLLEWNVSSTHDFAPSDEHRERARRVLKRDYQIYDDIAR